MAQSPLVPHRRWPLSESRSKPHLILAGEATSSGAGGLPASHQRESDPEWMAGDRSSSSAPHFKNLQWNQSVWRWCNCKWGDLSDLLGKIYTLFLWTGGYDLTQGESFTLPRIWHRKFLKLYMLIALSFSQRCLLFISLGFKEVVT